MVHFQTCPEILLFWWTLQEFYTSTCSSSIFFEFVYFFLTPVGINGLWLAAWLWYHDSAFPDKVEELGLNIALSFVKV